jgi:hypothetical protein
MEKQKSPDEMFMTVVFNITRWSDTQMDQMTNRSDVKSLSMSNAIQEKESLQIEKTLLKEEIKRLKWMMTEHD